MLDLYLPTAGAEKPRVPYAQATEFDAALGKGGVSATLFTGTDGGHVFFTPELLRHMRGFLDRHLLGREATIPETAIKVK